VSIFFILATSVWVNVCRLFESKPTWFDRWTNNFFFDTNRALNYLWPFNTSLGQPIIILYELQISMIVPYYYHAHFPNSESVSSNVLLNFISHFVQLELSLSSIME
jgi:hypothetical protein